MKKIIRNAIILVVIDQLLKFIITHTLALNETVVLIKNHLAITYLTNSGAAWSILEGNTIFLIILGLIAIGFIIVLIRDEKFITPLNTITYSLLIGGITGNLIDRLYAGKVIDFININAFNFPIFNFSDICIVIGVIIFAYINLRSEIYDRIQGHQKFTSRQISRRSNVRNQKQNSKTNQKRQSVSQPHSGKS